MARCKTLSLTVVQLLEFQQDQLKLNRQFLQKVLRKYISLYIFRTGHYFEQDNLDEASLIVRFGAEAMDPVDVLDKKREESLNRLKHLEQSLQTVCAKV